MNGVASEDPGAGPMPVFKGRIDVRNKSKKVPAQARTLTVAFQGIICFEGGFVQTGLILCLTPLRPCCPFCAPLVRPQDIQSLRLSLIMRVEQTAGPTLKEDFVLWREIVTAVPLPPDKTLEDRRFLGALKVRTAASFHGAADRFLFLSVEKLVARHLDKTHVGKMKGR